MFGDVMRRLVAEESTKLIFDKVSANLCRKYGISNSNRDNMKEPLRIWVDSTQFEQESSRFRVKRMTVLQQKQRQRFPYTSTFAFVQTNPHPIATLQQQTSLANRFGNAIDYHH